MHIRDQEQRSHRDLERPIDAAIYLRRHSTRFERQLLTINEQIGMKPYLYCPENETELLSNLFDVDHDLEQEARFEEDNEMASRTVALGQTIQGTELRLRSLSELVDIVINTKGSFHGGEPEGLDKYLQELKESAKSCSHSINVHLSARDINRWKLASRAIQTDIRTFELSGPRESPTDNFRNLLIQRHKDWPRADKMWSKIEIVAGFSLAAFIYGGLHALAWSAHFHSSTEQLLWRISACIVMGSLPVIYAVARLYDRLEPHLSKLWEDLIVIIIAAPFVLLISAYVLARAYLVVECFINISHLPAGVYDLPNWSAYFPHIA